VTRTALSIFLAGALLAGASLAAPSGLQKARDLEDRPQLERTLAELTAAAEKAPNDAAAQYQVALAASYLAEISLELRDKAGAERAAKTGISAAERAVTLKPDNAGYHRVLGTLCGQVIPANVLLGISYGKRAEEAIEKAIALDPKFAQAYLARGIGNYYKPAMFGGGPELAIRDIRRAIELDPKSAEAYLWLGLALRKTHHNAEAREAFTKSLELNPNRVWTKQQLDKTPAS
jgi:tetratricopeptide (TPR) repeat protein